MKFIVGALMFGLGFGGIIVLGEKASDEVLVGILCFFAGLLGGLPVTIVTIKVVRRSTIAEMDLKHQAREARMPATPPPGYGAQPNIIMMPGMMPAQQAQPKGGIIPQGTFQTMANDPWG